MKDAPRMPGRTSFSNVIKFRPGLNEPALNANSPEERWGVFIRPEIIGVLVEHTNSIITTKKSSYTQSCRTNDTDDVEMKALIGLLMLAGIYHANRLNLKDIWNNNGTGIDVFKMTMSLNRFRFLFCCLRFVTKQHLRRERRWISLPQLNRYLRCLLRTVKRTALYQNL